MILVIGEILYDIFPSYKRIGGAPFNFAFHLKELGFDVRFVSRVGKDDLGGEIQDFAADRGFDPADVQTDDTFPTGQVKVTMARDGSHSFSIREHAAYDRLEFTPRLKRLCDSAPKMAYFGTLTQRTDRGHRFITKVLNSLPKDTEKFCDINLRPGWTRPVVDRSVDNCHTLKLSRDELDILVPVQTLCLEERAGSLLGQPGPKRIILTLGDKGSLWVSSHGLIRAPAGEHRPLAIEDTVGAGDAYAAMAAAAGLSGLGDDTAMALAHEFAAGICQIKGALPRDSAFYTPFKKRLSNES